MASLPTGYPPKEAPLQPGCLYLVATPIGNLEDITLRAIRVLQGVDLVAAEDTRTARSLLKLLGIDKPLISLFEANEAQRVPQLLERLESGESVAVISEAGTPSVSDPGHQLNRACREAGLPVDAIPGPSAVINALLLSALSPARFRFLGFLPRKGSARRALLEELAKERDTAVIYESPHRLRRTLEDLRPHLGQREVVVAREMTKLHQEVLRGSAEELSARFQERPPRGELCLLVAGAEGPPSPPCDEPPLEEQVLARLAAGESPKTIAQALTSPERKRREVYQLALRLRDHPVA